MLVKDLSKCDKKYRVIYSDPAWQFSNKKTGGSMASAAEQKYTVTSIDDMCELPVADLCDDDCLLVMWYVGSMPDEALKLARAWGFRVVNINGFVWDKETKKGLDYFGMGFTTRASTESALIGVKGKLGNLIKSHSVRAKIRAKVGEHSEKPQEFRDAIEKLCGNVPRIELFARNKVDGWDRWGNEA
jgi:N6-adenosine-specific RNA methylase IME4